MGHHEGGIRLGTFEARTRRQKSRTRLRCGDLATCFFFPRLALTRLKLSPIHAKSHRVSGKTAEMADSAWNLKKKRTEKRRCEMHRLNLITNPKVCFSYALSCISLHPNPNFSSLILHPSSLCALYDVRSCWGKYQIVWEKCVFPFSYSFGA